MIRFTAHALERMQERGATQAEVERTISEGTSSPARQGRTRFRYTFPFNDVWNDTFYAHKRITAYAAEEAGDWVVITIICHYF